MFGNKKKDIDSLRGRVARAERTIDRLNVGPPTVVLKKLPFDKEVRGHYDLTSIQSYTGSGWVAEVGGELLYAEVIRREPMGWRQKVKGYPTAAAAEKVANDYIKNLKVVTVK